jgi:hypothetical protein
MLEDLRELMRLRGMQPFSGFRKLANQYPRLEHAQPVFLTLNPETLLQLATTFCLARVVRTKPLPVAWRLRPRTATLSIPRVVAHLCFPATDFRLFKRGSV